MANSVMSVLRNIDFSPGEIAQRLHCKRCRWPKVSGRQVSSVGGDRVNPALCLATYLISVASRHWQRSAAPRRVRATPKALVYLAPRAEVPRACNFKRLERLTDLSARIEAKGLPAPVANLETHVATCGRLISTADDKIAAFRDLAAGLGRDVRKACPAATGGTIPSSKNFPAVAIGPTSRTWIA
jgi:hypothetical protein